MYTSRFLAVLIIISALPGCSGDRERPEGPGLPPAGITPVMWELDSFGPRLYGVWASSPANVYAVGNSGAVIHYDGTKITRVDIGASAPLFDIYGLSPDDIYAVGREGVFHYENNRWSRVYPLERGALKAVWAGSPHNVCAVGESPLLYNNGDGWSRPLGTASSGYDVWGTPDWDVYVVRGRGYFYHFDGTHWHKIAIPDEEFLVERVWASSSDNVYLVGYGDIYHYDGSGFTKIFDEYFCEGAVWGRSPSDVFACLGCIHEGVRHFDGTGWSTIKDTRVCLDSFSGAGPDALVFAGGQARIQLYNGVTTELIHNGISESYWGMSGTSDGSVFVLGYDRGEIGYFNGKRWSQTPVYSPHLDNVWAYSPTDLWGIGPTYIDPFLNGAGIYYFDGADWALQRDYEFPYRLFDIWGTSPDDFFVVGSEDLIHFNGSEWIETPNTRYSGAISGNSSNDVYIVGGLGDIVHFDGELLTEIPSGTTEDLRAVWCGGVGGAVAVGSNGVIVRVVDGTARLEAGGTTATLRAVTGNCLDDVYAVGDNGTILHYDGNRWYPVLTEFDCSFRCAWSDGLRTFVGGDKDGIILRLVDG